MTCYFSAPQHFRLLKMPPFVMTTTCIIFHVSPQTNPDLPLFLPLSISLASQYSNKGCSSDLNKLPSTRPGEIVRRPSTFLSESSYTLLLFAVAKGLTEIVRVLLKSAEAVTELDEVSCGGRCLFCYSQLICRYYQR